MTLSNLQVRAEAELLLRQRRISKRQKAPDLSKLESFVAAAWHVLEPATPFVNSWHITAICEHLEAITTGQIRKLLINVPPRHSKSLIVSVFWPCWEWTKNPASRWLFASYDQALATRDTVKARDLINSMWYQQYFGHVFRMKSDVNMKTRYENNRTGLRVATSLASGITGEGANRRVVDDPHSFKQALSDDVRERQIETYKGAFLTRHVDPKTDADVVVMQRLHESDLAGYILDNFNYEHLCLPSEFDSTRRSHTSIGWQDPRTKDGDLLNPGRFGPDEIAEAKTNLGSANYAGQHGQNPSPAGGNLIKKHWFGFYQLPGQNLPDVPVRTEDGLVHVKPVDLPGFEHQVLSLDCNFKEGKDNDFVALGVWGATGSSRYLLKRRNEKVGIVQTIRMVEEAAREYPEARAKYVESAANGPAVVQLLKDKLSGLILVTPQELGGSKVARVHAVVPELEAGNVFLPHPALDADIFSFVDQCATFPNAAHDDEVDQMTQALIKLQKTMANNYRATPNRPSQRRRM